MILGDVDIANDDCDRYHDRYQYDIDGSGFIEADELKVSLNREALCPTEGNLKNSHPLTFLKPFSEKLNIPPLLEISAV